MTKPEIIEVVAKETGLTKKDTGAVINAFTDAIVKALKKGDKVQLVGFGTFEVAERPARTGRNPQTGATIKIAASKAPKFKVGKAFKEAVK